MVGGEPLAAEVARLRAENARLRRLLELTPAQIRLPVAAQTGLFLDRPGPVTAVSSGVDKVRFFRALFAARADVYATRWENVRTGRSGWVPAVAGGWRKGEDRPRLRLTDAVVEAHLTGEVHVGLYPMLAGDTCQWLAADFRRLWDLTAHEQQLRGAGDSDSVGVAARSRLREQFWICNVQNMRMSEGVEWALHSCLNLSWVEPGQAMTARALAGFYELPTAYLNKQLQALTRAGILSSGSGPRGGFQLAQRPEKISLLDVVIAIEGPDEAFRCEEILRRGPGGRAEIDYRKTCLISQAMATAELAWRRELAAHTIADLKAAVERQFPTAPENTRDWFVKVRA